MDLETTNVYKLPDIKDYAYFREFLGIYKKQEPLAVYEFSC